MIISNVTLEELKTFTKEGVRSYIKDTLRCETSACTELQKLDFSNIRVSNKCFLQHFFEEDHRSFDMSGDAGSILFNLSILSEFEYLGIFDATDYLCLKFHNGCGTLYYKSKTSYFHRAVDLSKYDTTDIIYSILEQTVL